MGDVANFGGKVERDLNNELRSVKLDVRPVTDDMAKQIDKGVADAGKSFDGLKAKAKDSLGGIGDEAAKAGASLGGLKDQAKDSLGGLGEEADRAGDRIGEGVGKGTDKARDHLGRFVKKAGDSGRDASTRFRLGFGNLSVELGGVGAAAGLALTTAFKGAAVASAANTASQLVVALAPAVGALGVLPAAFIGAKVAAGAFQIAIMGVADAVSAGLTGDTAAFNEELEKMPKTAQAAVKEIVSLKDSIFAVREVVQGNFFGQLNGQIAPLGTTYLPMISNQLGRIARGFGEAAATSASFLRMPSQVASVNSALTDTGTAVNNVTAGLPGLIRAFLPLWRVGSSFLPGLTGGFDTLTQRIGKFMENAEKTGKLKEFISGGLSAVGELGKILASVGSILKSVFDAASASGGGLLGIVGQALSTFAAFLKTAEGAAALQSIFKVLGQVAGLFGQALGLVLPIIGQLVTVLAGALQPVLPIISSLMQQMAPVLAQVGQLIGAVLGPAIQIFAQLLATLVPVLLPIISTLISGLMPIVAALMPVIAALGQTIATVLVSALTALAPVFAQLLPVISQILNAILIPLLPVIGQLGELFVALMPAITPLIALFTQLLIMALKPIAVTTPLLVQALGFLIGVFIKLIGPLAAAIGWVANFFTELLKTRTIAGNAVNAFNLIKSTVNTVFNFVRNLITTVWNNIKSSTSTVWGWIKSYITAQINAVKAVLRGIGAAIDAVVGFFNRMRSGASSALSSMKAAVSSAVSQVISFFGRLASGAQAKISSLISTVRGIGGKIRAAVGNLSSLLLSAGRNVIQGLINGISQKLGALRSKASSAASVIRNLFPFSPAKEGPLSGRGSPEIAGRKIATMIAAGMQRSIPEVQASAVRVAKATQGPASGHGSPSLTRWQILHAALAAKRKAAEEAARRAREARDALKPAPSGGGGSGGSGNGDGPTFIFASGSIVLNFYGMAPGTEEAHAAGRAAGRGLAEAFAARDVRTTVRTI